MRGTSGALTKNLFTEGMSSVQKGDLGENLTRSVLQTQFKGAEILEQVNIKMDGASTIADFVVTKDGKILGIFESKVDGGSLSNGQRLFYKDGEVGILTGKNAGNDFRGATVDPSKIQTNVYRWDSSTGTYSVK